MTLCEISSSSRSTRASRVQGHHLRPRAQAELALLVLLFVAYSVGRLLGHPALPTP